MLIIEDNAAMRHALRTFLQGRFGDVRINDVDNAAAAIALSMAEPPEVVLLDLGLPGVTGFDLLQRLRALLPAAAIIVISHAASALYAERALAAGADGYIDKDRVYEELMPTIARARAQRCAPSSGAEGPA